jgi:hypothetical protein
MDGNFQQATLSDRARLCQLSFDQCLARFVCVSPQSRAAIEDQLGRFSIWAANNGLFAPARASLDYRLREAEDVQRLVMGLLRTLDESIQKCLLIRLADKLISADPPLYHRHRWCASVGGHGKPRTTGPEL